MNKEEHWDLEIKPKAGLLDINLKEVWKYRDLMFLFVKRDIVTVYQQTILGPVWFFLQPILTAFTYFIVFSKIANISTGEVPQMLFYLSGITIWNYFTTCLSGASTTFTSNAAIFGKVYFPRLVTPLSAVISNIIKFGIQLLPLLLMYLFFVINGSIIRPTLGLLLLPLLLFNAGFLGMALGLIVSSLTTKYRDFSFIINVLIQSLMYLSTVIYPLSSVKNDLMHKCIEYNPMTWVIDAFRFGCFGVGSVSFEGLLYATIITLVIGFLGIIMFSKTEKTFIDTV